MTKGNRHHCRRKPARPKAAVSAPPSLAELLAQLAKSDDELIREWAARFGEAEQSASPTNERSEVRPRT